MSEQASISEFLQQAGYQFRVFDLSRQVHKLNKAEFLAWEQRSTPWPLPLLGQAQLALIFWNKKNRQDPQIWFLQLPLDAQGLLLSEARDDVLLRIVQSVSDHIDHKQEADQWLQQNPYALETPPERRAVLNAKVRQLLKLPISPALEQVKAQLALPEYDWAQLPFQGLAELALDQKSPAAIEAQCRLARTLPTGAFASFACCLENEVLSSELSDNLLERVDQAVERADSQDVAASLQALTHSANNPARQQRIDQLLQSPMKQELALLTMLAGRCWRDLEESARLQPFLENLAQVDAPNPQVIFCRVVQDLLGLPNLRAPVMQALRNPERSDALSVAIGALFSANHPA